MSDSVRNYTGHAGSLSTVPRSRRRGRGCFSRIVLPALVLLLVTLWWLTRDTYGFVECIPRGERFTVVVDEPLPARERIVQSRVWDAVPESWRGSARPDLLTVDLGIPEWVVRNLFYKRAFVTGNKFDESADVVVLTRMTRIGTLLERFHRLHGAVEDDYAGGLRLRTVPDEGLYYAVRGRILLASPSREALIRSLTLTENDRLEQDKFDELAQAGKEDIRGTLVLTDDQALGDTFETIAFAVRIDESMAQARCRGTLRPGAAKRFGPLLNGARPATLKEPHPGMIALSANFGKPVREVWSGLGEVTGAAWLSEAQWQAWREGVAVEPPGVAPFVTALLGARGPGIRLTVSRVDVNELAPLPIVVGSVDGDPGAAVKLFESIPPLPEEAKPWEAYPRYDAERQIAFVPSIGGPSLEPAAAVDRGMLTFSSSRAALEAALSEEAPAGDLPNPGNLYVQLRPAPLVNAIVESGRLLVEMEGLRGYTAETFEAAAAEWTGCAGVVDEITALASARDGKVDVDLRIVCDGGSRVNAGG